MNAPSRSLHPSFSRRPALANVVTPTAAQLAGEITPARFTARSRPGFRMLHLIPQAVIGGCEMNCLRLIEGLAGCDHEVLVFDERGPCSAKWEQAGARVTHLAAWEKGRRGFRAALARWQRSRSQPDAAIYWSNSRLPLILEVLRDWSMPWAVHLGNPAATGWTAAARGWLWERLHGVPDHVTLVACSNRVAESHRRAPYFRRFSCAVVYNPVPPVFDQVREYRALPVGSNPRVGMVARLDSIKDHLTVIRAVAAMAGVRDDVVVEFAGDGELRARLEREASALGQAGRVRFLGFTEIRPLLVQWDVYVHATTAAEGMGTAVAEAMMAGLPCVVSDLEVMREVGGHDGAQYAAAGDASALAKTLLRLIEDQAGRRALGLAAQARARRMFALPQVADAYLRVIGGKNSGGTS